MICVTRSFAALRILALATLLTTAVAGGPAFAGKEGTPLVATRTYKVCGSWNNKLATPYPKYTISNYNDFVPAGVTISPLLEIPSSTWRFFYDGTFRGYPYNDAFLANLSIVDQTGVVRPQMLYGAYHQKSKQLKLELNTTLLAEALFLSTNVNTANEQIVATAPTGFVDSSGPFRFRKGTATGNTLPSPLNETTSYYIKYIPRTDSQPSATFQVSLLPGGTAVNLVTRGTGTHTIYPFGDPLANSYRYLSQLFLLGGLDTVGVLSNVTSEKIKLKLSPDRSAMQLGVRLRGRTLYDIVTPDYSGAGDRGAFDYWASSENCFVP